MDSNAYFGHSEGIKNDPQLPNQPSSERDMIRLLQEQNQMLREVCRFLQCSAEANSETVFQIRTRVTDVDLSIGSMIGLMFKWLVASIPVGIVVFICYVILASLLTSVVRSLF